MQHSVEIIIKVTKIWPLAGLKKKIDERILNMQNISHALSLMQIQFLL